MSLLKAIKKLEIFIIGEKKPNDHWKKYQKTKKIT